MTGEVQIKELLRNWQVQRDFHDAEGRLLNQAEDIPSAQYHLGKYEAYRDCREELKNLIKEFYS